MNHLATELIANFPSSLYFSLDQSNVLCLKYIYQIDCLILPIISLRCLISTIRSIECVRSLGRQRCAPILSVYFNRFHTSLSSITLDMHGDLTRLHDLMIFY